MKYFSQDKQDKFINEVFFRNRKKGFFIDIGAHNGITFSNSCFFEKNLGWNGLCVEPIPEVFQSLKNNRSCILENACITDEDKEVTFTRISGYGEMLSGITDKYDPRHLERIKRTINEKGGGVEEIKVKGVRLLSLIEKYRIQNVDFLSVDTEGNEWPIIQSIPFDQVQPKLILVENNYNDNRIKEFLFSKGYVFCINLMDDVFHYGPLSFVERVRLFRYKLFRYLSYRIRKFKRQFSSKN